MKKRINPKNIAEMMKDQGLTYDEVQELSNGKISSDMLKKRLPHGGYFKDEQISIMANILHCKEDELVDPTETVADNLPSFIGPIISRLYYRLKKSHRIVYQYCIKAQLTSESFRNRFGQANRILAEMTGGDDIYAPETTDRTLKLIIDCFGMQNALPNIWNRFTDNENSKLLKLMKESRNDTQEQRLLLLFFYVHTIFYTIFLGDLIFSIFSYSIERKAKNFNIYKDIATRNDILHITLIERILSNAEIAKIDNDPVMNMKQHLVDSILLMLCACKKSGEVITDDHRNSLCLDDSELDAIITRLEKTFENLGIETIVYTPFQYMQSPFCFVFESIQNEYMAKKEERKIAEEKLKIEQEKTKQIIISVCL
jgi:hypothetical protein